jgi:hypothetical protein
VFAPDGARFDSAGTLRNQVMRYFGYHGAINGWQPEDQFTGQSRREDQDGPDGMREAGGRTGSGLNLAIIRWRPARQRRVHLRQPLPRALEVGPYFEL